MASYTDAAIIETQGHRVIATAKAITTKGDLAVGVLEAIRLALTRLPHELSPADVSLVSVSTTLATNAVVEGHGSAVGVLLIGFDEAMAERTGIAKAFPGVPLALVGGGHDHAGSECQALDEVALQEAVDRMSERVDAFAIAWRFAVRNPAHELAARAWVHKHTGKPTLSTELSSSLDAPRRALTATLNARLISRVSQLIDAVQRAMATLHIACPLMIVKGDGTLALAEAVAKRPMKPCCPALLRAWWGPSGFPGVTASLCRTWGGTTTDLGILQNGLPKVTEEGAEVGGWRTMVRAVDVRTGRFRRRQRGHTGCARACARGPAACLAHFAAVPTLPRNIGAFGSRHCRCGQGRLHAWPICSLTLWFRNRGGESHL